MSASSPAPLVREFDEVCDSQIEDSPTIPAQKVQEARVDMAWEEWDEHEREVCDWLEHGGDAEGHIANVARELADAVYIAYETALRYGVDLDAVIAEVHAANMRKCPDGKAKKDRTGKVLKPDGWTPPDVRRVIFG